MYYENFDLQNIVTPANVAALQKILQQTGYDNQKTEFLIEGFTHGFDIGYRGNPHVKMKSTNLKLDPEYGTKVTLWK